MQAHPIPNRRPSQEAAGRLESIYIEALVSIENGQVDRLAAVVGELAEKRSGAVAQFNVDPHRLA
jgi:hypothetical protein